MIEVQAPAPTYDPVRGVWLVKLTPRWRVELLEMAFNWRVVLTPHEALEVWDHGWCFFGTGQAAFVKATLAAMAFDPDTQAHPAGYDKALTTRR